MNDAMEVFERELTELRPQQPSMDLQRRIELEVRTFERPQQPSSASMWSVVVTTAVLAACLLVAVLQKSREGIGQPEPDATMAAGPVLSESLPTFWTYHRAVTMPSASLDRLLDQHAGKTAMTNDSLLHVHAFRNSQNLSAWGGL